MGLWDLKQHNKTSVVIELIKCDRTVTCAELLQWILSQAENSPFHQSFVHSFISISSAYYILHSQGFDCTGGPHPGDGYQKDKYSNIPVIYVLFVCVERLSSNSIGKTTCQCFFYRVEKSTTRKNSCGIVGLFDLMHNGINARIVNIVTSYSMTTQRIISRRTVSR